MAPKLVNLTPSMRFRLAKMAIASILVEERDSQIGKATSELPASEIDFNVFMDMFSFPDVAKMPCMNVYNNKGTFDSSREYTDGSHHVYHLNIDLYSVSTAEKSEGVNAPSNRADQLAAARLDYLFGQAFGILKSEAYYTNGVADFVQESRFVQWEQYRVDGKEEGAETVLGIRATLELQFYEATEILTGEEFQELVISLNIKDEFIDPFVTINY